jgi:RHS repeat-associated protein
VVSSQVLDAEGHLVSAGIAGTDPVSFTHDGQGRVTAITQGARTSSVTFDGRGRKATETSPEGEVTSFAFDASDRVSSTVRPGGQTRGYDYDVRGNRTSVTMSSGSVHPFTFDGNDLQASYTAPGAQGRLTSRDLDGATTSVAWPSGRSVGTSYDAGGRLSGFTQPGGSTAFGWTGATDRLATVGATTPGGTATQTIGYDGDLMTSLDWSGAVVGSFDYTYDNNGWLSQLSMTSGADNVVVPVTRNGDGALSGVGPFTFTNNGPGKTLSSVNDGTGSLELGYRSTGEIDDRHVRVSGTTKYRHEVTARDLDGRITGVSEVTPSGTDTVVYVYDDSGRLASSTRNALPTVTFSYDADGNLTGGGNGGAATFDAADRVTTVGGTAYGHDGDGYLTTRGTDTFAYGVRGELRSATVAGATVTYASDGWGRRVTRTTAAGTEQYFYGDPASSVRLTASRSPAGVLSFYWYDDDNHLVAITRGGATFYVGSDHLGTPKVVTDAAGVTVLTRSYDAFGTRLSDSNPAFGLPIGFAGGLEDPLTGLVRMGHRDYLPEAGQFTAPDPLLFEGGFNLFSYVAGDPVNSIDPNGLKAVCVGANAYLGLGMGGEVCVGMDENGYATMSVCGELGKGFSSGGGFALKEEVGSTTATIFGEGGVTVLGLSGGIGAEAGYQLDECGKWQNYNPPPGWKLSAMFRSVSRDGTMAYETHNAEKPYGIGIGIKMGVRGCIRIA